MGKHVSALSESGGVGSDRRTTPRRIAGLGRVLYLLPRSIVVTDQ